MNLKNVKELSNAEGLNSKCECFFMVAMLRVSVAKEAALIKGYVSKRKRP